MLVQLQKQQPLYKKVNNIKTCNDIVMYNELIN